MKNLIILFVVLLSVKAIAQNFEGTIKWSIKTELTDPKQKAQMEEAQKKMNDPATQAQMKQMQEKMNDPQFKAMMESNPQMKEQMERMMAGLQSGNVNSLMPTGLTIKIKNLNTLIKMDGGMFGSEILHLQDKDKTFTIDRKNKTYSIMNTADKAASTQDADVKVTKTNETAKILNYNCTKYNVDITSNGTKMTQYVWSTTEIKDFDLKALAKQRFGKNQRMFYEGIDGVPLKMEIKTKEANMVMEVIDIRKESLSVIDFAIPSDFKEVPGMFK